MSDIEKIRELLAKATPGPWEQCQFAEDMDEYGIHAPEHADSVNSGKEPPHHMAHAITICRGMTGNAKDNNSQLICLLRKSIEPLLDELSEANRRVGDLEKALRTIASRTEDKDFPYRVMPQSRMEDIARDALTKSKGVQMGRQLTTEEIQEKINTNWSQSALSLYLAQVLSGECSIEDTLDDLLSLDEGV